jgi:hypothetical protein
VDIKDPHGHNFFIMMVLTILLPYIVTRLLRMFGDSQVFKDPWVYKTWGLSFRRIYKTHPNSLFIYNYFQKTQVRFQNVESHPFQTRQYSKAISHIRLQKLSYFRLVIFKFLIE